jgi:predicted alpha/beta-hydrolase family hydrolase
MWKIRVGEDETTAAWDPPAAGSEDSTVFICAHGAGGHMADRSVVAVTSALQRRGIGTVRFNFFYRAKSSRRPDPMPRLLPCYAAVVERVRAELQPRTLILGGRSMGSRAASMLVADGEPCDGLLLLAYPLHPPGQPEKLRTAHLPEIRVPVLCINGTRDAFCEPPLMEQTLAQLGANWRMRWIDGADHSFHVLKSSGRTDADVLGEIGDEVKAWATTILGRAS